MNIKNDSGLMALRFLPIILLLFTGGCAVKDGIRIPGSGTTKAEAADFERRVQIVEDMAVKEFAKHAIKDAIATTDPKLAKRGKLIVIGNVMAFSEFGRSEVEEAFKRQIEARTGDETKIPQDKAWFTQKLGGHASVKYWEIPLVIHRHVNTYVPNDLSGKIGFPSLIAALTYGATGDLVAASSVDGYGVWINLVLCRKAAPNFEECSSDFQKGMFQGNDGREVGADLLPVQEGKQINLATLRPVKL